MSLTPICPPSQDLVTNGAQVSICNKYGETPMDKAKPHLRELLRGILTPHYHLPHSNRVNAFFIVFVFNFLIANYPSTTTQTKLRKWDRT